MAESLWVPYPGHCDTIGPDYRKLIGLNLLQDFRRHLQARLGGVHGCTHLTELANVLPTAAVQAFAGEVFKTRDSRARRTPAGREDAVAARPLPCAAPRRTGGRQVLSALAPAQAKSAAPAKPTPIKDGTTQ